MSTVLPPAGNSGLPTLADAQNGPLADIAGACPNGSQFISWVNQASERLLYRGDWRCTVKPIQLQVQRGIVTTPRLVQTIRQFNVCRQGVPVWNQWYRFLEHQWHGTTCLGFWTGWLWHSPSMSQYGYSPLYAPIPTSSCVIQLQGIADDNNVTITIFGTDPSGNDLRTHNGDGTWSDGITLTLTQPFVTGTQLVQTITRVIKPTTNGYIQAFALDTQTGISTQIANWEPSNTNPAYAQYRLETGICSTQTFTSVALVKLKFIPVMVPSDPILVPNLNALKLMVQAIRLEEANDDDGAQKKIIKAVRELNLQKEDDIEEDQIPITVNPFGTATPRRAGIGRVL